MDALPPPRAFAFPVSTAAALDLGRAGAGGASTAQTGATMPVAPWSEAATSWPVSGLPSSQYSGVDAIPAPATVTIAILPPRDTGNLSTPAGSCHTVIPTRQLSSPIYQELQVLVSRDPFSLTVSCFWPKGRRE
ncbi:hypothetical protein ABIA33_007567 [Streptacidiphilus sp. MAP12-16]